MSEQDDTWAKLDSHVQSYQERTGLRPSKSDTDVDATYFPEEDIRVEPIDLQAQGENELTLKGLWNIYTPYVRFDVVEHNDVIWIAAGPSTGDEPESGGGNWVGCDMNTGPPPLLASNSINLVSQMVSAYSPGNELAECLKTFELSIALGRSKFNVAEKYLNFIVLVFLAAILASIIIGVFR